MTQNIIRYTNIFALLSVSDVTFILQLSLQVKILVTAGQSQVLCFSFSPSVQNHFTSVMLVSFLI